MVALLFQMHDLGRFHFSSLRYVTNTAAALPTAFIRKLKQLLPHVTIFSMYGLTECKRVSYLPPEYLDARPESVGVPMPNCEVIIRTNDGQEAEPGEVGELIIRGSNVMQGYWNDPEATAKVFGKGTTRSDSWLYSGDLFKQDREGFLYFVCRKDDMIKTRGERVSPREVEDVLCSMDGVAEAAVIGVADEILGQAIQAFIVQDFEHELTQEQVLKFCSKELEPFMVPKYIEFKVSLPRSPSNKIDKRALHSSVANGMPL
jgi:acyl-CoA synthetase (AMP-forming)/AMP-acid ligase II